MITGIHHVTALASDPQTNIDFYVGVLGLKLVKTTINYDDPGMYHFYYGDGVGRPGTILTFFPLGGIRRGRIGTGQVVSTALSVPVGSTKHWSERLTEHGVPFDARQTAISLADPDGLALILKEIEGDVRPGDNDAGCVAPEFAIRGIDSVTLQVAEAAPTLELLTERMGFDISQDGDGRFTAASDVSGNAVYLHESEEGDARGLSGPGTVHHVAFRLPSDAEQDKWRDELLALGYHVSPVMDRQYFHSIYYREPGGILFELATDTPGFLADGETVETLGRRLQLPQKLEAKREIIEAHLPKLRIP
ncbi:MAG: ring-cleaving dioxygenase [Akkermansiaceae bacterium]|nr:ring-cleaving dioxygenase [Armatimonadota bacterium]